MAHEEKYSPCGGSTSEAQRIKDRLKPSTSPEATVIGRHGDGPTRVVHSVLHRGQNRPHGNDQGSK